MISQTTLAQNSIPEEERLRRIVSNVQANFNNNSSLTKNITRALESTVMANPRLSQLNEGFEADDADQKHVQSNRDHQKTLAELREEKRQQGQKTAAEKQTEFRKSSMAMNTMYLMRDQQNTMIRISFLLAAVGLMYFLNTMISINPMVMQILMVLFGIFVGRELFFLFEGRKNYTTGDYETIRGRGDKIQRTEGFAPTEEGKDEGDAEEPKGSNPDETFVAAVEM